MDGLESLPVLFIRAKSHYEIGLTVGKAMKSWINEYCDTSNDLKRFREFYQHEEGKNIVDTYINTSNKSHPGIMSEIRGMADGAGLKFVDIFLLQIASELDFYHIEEIAAGVVDGSKISKGCTDVLVNRKKSRVIGHNEDWTDEVSAYVYIVHVTLTDGNGSEMEQFVSYCNPGYLPGFCYGMNKSLVITLNSLHPNDVNRNSTPLLICLRSLFKCHTIDDCLKTMKNGSYGCAFGMNINIAEINNTSMCSIEVYPDKGDTKFDVHPVPVESPASIDWYYIHANMYKHTNIEQTIAGTGSRLRDKRASEMPPPKNVDDVRTILGDVEDKKEPIYRTPNPAHINPACKTSSTAVFDIDQRMMLVYRSNPKTASAPILSIPFL
ncbi:hypothetical protein ACF0H5_020161 [Mactra antiquata]